MNALDVEQKAKIGKGRFLKFLVLVNDDIVYWEWTVHYKKLASRFQFKSTAGDTHFGEFKLKFVFSSWMCSIQPSTLHAIILVNELFFTLSHLLDFIMAALCVSSYVNFNYLVLNKRVIQFGKETLPFITLVFWQCNEKSLTWFAISLLIIQSTQHNPARRVALNQGIDNYPSYF